MSAVSPEDSRADLLLSGESVAFGKYWLTRLIARGGMGEVYLARLVGEFGFEKRLVIKTILPHLAAKPRFVELFAAEAKTAVALSHGNIVPIYELGRADDTFYIVMGHVDGPSVATLLDAYRRQQRVPELAVALHVLRGVLTGLAYAHTSEPGRPAVVHRDITPRNVIVDRSGQVRIVDFGIAAPADAEVDVRAGSTGYVAPEQMRGDTVDPRADVFSAACLLYELLTLERAFPKEGVWVTPDLDVLPDVLKAPLGAALAIDPAERPSDASELLVMLGPAFARYAATYGDGQLSAHLRQLFPDGWDDDSRPAVAGELPPKGGGQRRSTETFATRLTLVTRTPILEAQQAAAAARPRRWPWLAALALGGGVTWAVIVAQPSTAADPEPRTPVAAAPEPAPADPVPPRSTTPAPEPAPLSSTQPEPSGPETVEPAAVPPRVVSLRVEPTTASVTVDGKKAADPGKLELPRDRPVKVVVTNDGFAPRSFLVDDEHPLPAAVTLKPLGTGKLRVIAAGVDWAEVAVDGRKVGSTPQTIALPEGKHRVVVTCTAEVCGTKRALLTKTVTIKADATTELQAKD